VKISAEYVNADLLEHVISNLTPLRLVNY